MILQIVPKDAMNMHLLASLKYIYCICFFCRGLVVIYRYVYITKMLQHSFFCTGLFQKTIFHFFFIWKSYLLKAYYKCRKRTEKLDYLMVCNLKEYGS